VRHDGSQDTQAQAVPECELSTRIRATIEIEGGKTYPKARSGRGAEGCYFVDHDVLEAGVCADDDDRVGAAAGVRQHANLLLAGAATNGRRAMSVRLALARGVRAGLRQVLRSRVLVRNRGVAGCCSLTPAAPHFRPLCDESVGAAGDPGSFDWVVFGSPREGARQLDWRFVCLAPAWIGGSIRG